MTSQVKDILNWRRLLTRLRRPSQVQMSSFLVKHKEIFCTNLLIPLGGSTYGSGTGSSYAGSYTPGTTRSA